MNYAIVDIETTGGSAARHKITEVAIFIFDGEKIVNSYQTLINPERHIPTKITQLTGITDEMVAEAPTFAEVAEKIQEVTKDCAFVAHNANFDYGFIRNEFREIGLKYQRKKLCTVRLSRKLLPGSRSYSLDNVCRRLDIPIEDRHRAAGDARATVEVLHRLLQIDEQNFIEYSLNQLSREGILPPNLPRETFESLPLTMGVYYFHNAQGKVIYVGKANNIKERVTSHFQGNTNTNRKRHFIKNIFAVTYEEAHNELFALLMEAHAIKKHWPPYNEAMKRIRLNFGLFHYYDRKGYGRLAVGESSKTNRPLIGFRSRYEAERQLDTLMDLYDLCPRLCGKHRVQGACYDYKQGICKGACADVEPSETYNERFQQAINDLTGVDRTFILHQDGKTEEDRAVVLVEKGVYRGYGFVPKAIDFEQIEEVKSFLQYGYDDQDIQKILHSFVQRNKVSKIILANV